MEYFFDLQKFSKFLLLLCIHHSFAKCKTHACFGTKKQMCACFIIKIIQFLAFIVKHQFTGARLGFYFITCL